jgi:LysW-gamma-L-lysine carboxypeptidase
MPSFPDHQVNLLRKIVELYSPTGKENEVAQLLVEEMCSLGLSCRIDEAGNAVGECTGEDSTILLCGHMDTVPGQLPVKLEGGKLYGRGTVDAKSALAAMVSAAGLLIAEDFPGKIIVVGAVDEEGKGQGIKKLVESGVRADFGVFGEPSGVEGITIAYKGSCHLRVICKTKTGHSSAPWLFHNAVDAAMAFWRELQKIHFAEEKTDSKFHSVTSTITRIQGGGSSSTVPSLCELHADFRLPPAVPLKRFLEEVSKTVENYRLSHSDVELLIEVDDSCEPYEADRNSTLVRGLAWAIRSIRGRPAMLLRKTGTGDMNVLGATLHVPIVTYGPGDSKLDHTDDEYIDLGEYSDSIRILREGLIKTLELRNRSMRR